MHYLHFPDRGTEFALVKGLEQCHTAMMPEQALDLSL